MISGVPRFDLIGDGHGDSEDAIFYPVMVILVLEAFLQLLWLSLLFILSGKIIIL